jgi:hypothetical protein
VPVCAHNPDDPIALNDHGCVRLDCAIQGVDNLGMGDGKCLRLNTKRQQGQGKKKLL